MISDMQEESQLDNNNPSIIDSPINHPSVLRRKFKFSNITWGALSVLGLLASMTLTVLAAKSATKLFSKAASEQNSLSDGTCPALKEFDGNGKDAYTVLQSCIDSSSIDSIVELPPGKYVIEKQLKINKPITLRTAGKTSDMPRCQLDDSSCTEIIAGDNLVEPWGVVYVGTNNFTLDHIIINGNKTSRSEGPAGKYISTGNTVYGHNLMVMSCNNCTFSNNVLKNGLAATAFGYNFISPQDGYPAVNNHDSTIRNNLIANNGVHNRSLFWSDGLSFSDGDRFTIKDNEFLDNTDIDFILGGCTNCTITGNKIRHSGSAEGGSFAAMNFQAWVQKNEQTSSGDYTGTIVSGNNVDCSTKFRCGFGLYLGSKAWGYTANKQLKGGTFSDNVITGAQQGFLADTYQGAVVKNNQIVSSGGYHKTSLGFRQMNSCNIYGGARIQFTGNSVTQCTSERWDNPFELANSWFTNRDSFDSFRAETFIKYSYYYLFDRPLTVTELSNATRALSSSSSRSSFLYNLALSSEFKTKYQIQNKSNSEYLSFLYNKILRRDGNQQQLDPTAFTTLLNRLNNGTSKDEITWAFFVTPELKQAFMNSLDLFDISSAPINDPTPPPTPTPSSAPTVTISPAPIQSTVPSSSRTIKGGVYCYDKSLPVSTGQIRPILGAKLMTVQDGTSEQKQLSSDQNGAFSFNTNLDTPFSVYLIDLSGATDRGAAVGGSVNPYVVANAEAKLASCQTQSLSFNNCQAKNLPVVSDGFAFVIRPCF